MRLDYENDHIGNRRIEARILILSNVVRHCIRTVGADAAAIYARIIGREALDNEYTMPYTENDKQRDNRRNSVG